jgi:hypothetical protein
VSDVVTVVVEEVCSEMLLEHEALLASVALLERRRLKGFRA